MVIPVQQPLQKYVSMFDIFNLSDHVFTCYTMNKSHVFPINDIMYNYSELTCSFHIRI